MIREVELTKSNPFARKIEYVEGENVLGYLDYSLIYDRLEIDNIYVLEEERSKGIATKMMAYLVGLAIDLRVINITLEVRISNEVARNLYKKFGFREVALRKYYYGDEDGILMEKQVM